MLTLPSKLFICSLYNGSKRLGAGGKEKRCLSLMVIGGSDPDLLIYIGPLLKVDFEANADLDYSLS